MSKPRAESELGEFYLRQVALPELGSEGQRRLRKSRAVVVGLGGLGSVSALYLTLAGINYLRLVDQDTVEMHNLHRQALYSQDDLRHPKVEAAAKRLRKINPDVKIEPVAENLRGSNVHELIHDTECLVDGLDNMRTRYILNAECVKNKIPYVYGGAIGLEGNTSVFRPPETACLECVFPGLDDRSLPTCETRGVLGATTGIIGAIQGMEAIKVLAGLADGLAGKLLVCDMRTMDFVTVPVVIRPDCPVCQVKGAGRMYEEERLAWLCGTNTVNVNPKQRLSLDLRSVSKLIAKEHRLLVNSAIVIVFGIDSFEVSLFRDGRMLIKNVSTEDEAISVYEEVSKSLGISPGN